jgi:hypothetical protein
MIRIKNVKGYGIVILWLIMNLKIWKYNFVAWTARDSILVYLNQKGCIQY